MGWLLVALLIPTRSRAEPEAGWEDAAPIELEGATVRLSKPVLVGRGEGHLWFPNLTRLSDGEMVIFASTFPDRILPKDQIKAALFHSGDSGLTWERREDVAGFSSCNLTLPSGEQLFLPYYLYLQEKGIGDVYHRLSPRSGKLEASTEPAVVTGLPRADRSFDPKVGVSGFVFEGQTVRLNDGGYLAPLYGFFEGDRRMSTIVASSEDGVRWTYRSTVAGADCKLEGEDGPSESTLCRLADGRLMCVFRLGSTRPFGQAYSSDEGRTWDEPKSMDGPFSVEPSAVVLPDGAVALSGGRNGLFLWLNSDGKGERWQAVDIAAHHNQALPDDPIRTDGHTGTTAYTEIVALDETHLLYVYDKLLNGWDPAGPPGNSVWVVRVTIEKN